MDFTKVEDVKRRFRNGEPVNLSQLRLFLEKADPQHIAAYVSEDDDGDSGLGLLMSLLPILAMRSSHLFGVFEAVHCVHCIKAILNHREGSRYRGMTFTHDVQALRPWLSLPPTWCSKSRLC